MIEAETARSTAALSGALPVSRSTIEAAASVAIELTFFIAFAFVASIPYSKFRHMFYTPLNVFFRDDDAKGALDTIPNLEQEVERDEPRLGVATLADFTWKRRMDFDACMRCGRCQNSCPAC